MRSGLGIGNNTPYRIVTDRFGIPLDHFGEIWHSFGSVNEGDIPKYLTFTSIIIPC